MRRFSRGGPGVTRGSRVVTATVAIGPWLLFWCYLRQAPGRISFKRGPRRDRRWQAWDMLHGKPCCCGGWWLGDVSFYNPSETSAENMIIEAIIGACGPVEVPILRGR